MNNTVFFSQLFEAEREIDNREQKIRDLESSLDVRREDDLRHDATIQSLRQKLADYETAYGNIEGAASRSELTIVTLQKQYNESQQLVVQLESSVRLGKNLLKSKRCCWVNMTICCVSLKISKLAIRQLALSVLLIVGLH